MAVNDDWEQMASTPAISGIDDRGRLVVQGELEFTCPECGTELGVRITLPLTSAQGGESDGQT